MTNGYEINDLAKEESWRMFRIIGEMVQGFDELAGVEPAISIYGSARIQESDDIYQQTVEIARQLGGLGFSIITGGGPGVMEAANRGAMEAGSKSIGLNITLPEEQVGNPYTNKSIKFSHFFVRKVMLVKYASAFVIMPGGLGTLDELTEVLTLMQTHKIKPFPVVLFSSAYWNGFLTWLKNTVSPGGYISPEDLNLLRVCDTPEAVAEIIEKWYLKKQIVGTKAVEYEI